MGSGDRYETPADQGVIDDNERARPSETIGYFEHGGEGSFPWQGSPIAPFVSVVPWRQESQIYKARDSNGQLQPIQGIRSGDIQAESNLIMGEEIDVQAWSTLNFLITYLPAGAQPNDQILELILEVSGSRRGDEDGLWFPYVSLRDYATFVQQSPDGSRNSGYLARVLQPTTYRSPRLADAATPVTAVVRFTVPWDVTPFQRARLLFKESSISDPQTNIAGQGNGDGTITLAYLLGT